MRLLLVLMVFIGSPVYAQYTCDDAPLVIDDYSDYANMMQGENAKAYLPSGAWYWDPDEPGVGLSISVQESKNSPSGIFVFGAFYTYKPDGTQAWYTVQGEYEANANANDWREDLEKFGTSVASTDTPSQTREVIGLSGCYWGNSDTWMGRLESPLYETSGGPVLDGDAAQGSIFEYKQAELVWLSPDQIEIYLDGSPNPAHTFERQNLHGDIVKGDADYITESTYHMDALLYGILPRNFAPDGRRVMFATRLQGNFKFRRFEPLAEFTEAPDWAINRFINFTEMHPEKAYYISNRPLNVSTNMTFNHVDDGSEVFLRYSDDPFISFTFYVVLAYDFDEKLIEAYLLQPTMAAAEGVETGLLNQTGGYRLKGYLPAEDQGRLSFYLAACDHCQNAYQLRKENVRRSTMHLYKLPDLGDAFERMPDLFSAGDNVQLENQ